MLQQSSTFGPLPRVLITFLQIAGLTGDNEITNSIGGTFTAYRECMINVMLSPFNFVSAVVAFVLLPIIRRMYVEQ